MTQPTINAKVTTVGNSYAILIPKALVDCGILEKGKKFRFLLDGPVEEAGTCGNHVLFSYMYNLSGYAVT